MMNVLLCCARGRRWAVMALGLFLVILVGPLEAMAHGTGFTQHDAGNAVSFSFYYATGEPLAYCAVRVDAPGGGDLEFQNGRTDQRGGFAFIPNGPGTWKIFVKDGRGHAVRAEALVEEGAEAVVLASTHRMPMVMAVVFGFSLLGNLFFMFRQRRKTP